MTARTVRLAIALVMAILLAAPAIMQAQGDRGRPPDGFGQCMADCVTNLSFLGGVGAKACQAFCRFSGGGGGQGG
jgi:hypothetical protein